MQFVPTLTQGPYNDMAYGIHNPASHFINMQNHVFHLEFSLVYGSKYNQQYCLTSPLSTMVVYDLYRILKSSLYLNSLDELSAKDMLFIRYSICCIFPLLRCRIGASDPRILWLDSVQNRNVFCQNMLSASMQSLLPS
ncbi:hypothetical protein D5086_020206 [Populus alba]|uniref:Uncharacterized protein n=1 Tax=Populus alba TaxID=43335 RepID=A0ACC4BK02_POPAL